MRKIFSLSVLFLLFAVVPVFGQTVTVGSISGVDCAPFSQSYINRFYIQGVRAAAFKAPMTIRQMTFYLGPALIAPNTPISFDLWLGTTTIPGQTQTLQKVFSGTVFPRGFFIMTVPLQVPFYYFLNGDLFFQVVTNSPTTFQGGCEEGLDPNLWRVVQRVDQNNGGPGPSSFRDGAGLLVTFSSGTPSEEN